MVQSQRFFTEVLGGELLADGATLRVRFGSFELALGSQNGGTTEPHNEHPHYAFLSRPRTFAPSRSGSRHSASPPMSRGVEPDNLPR
jgi:hypothetical protein